MKHEEIPEMLTLAVALVPLALYFFAIAALNSGRRARMLTGQEDMSALALGLIGFVMVGPMMLFLPVDALAFWGFYTWLFLAMLYALIVWFLGTAVRFRAIIYNITSEELRNAINAMLPELDSEARWAGNSLTLPTLGIQFYLERMPLFRNISLIASGSNQDLQGWLKFEKTLAAELLKHHMKRSMTPIFFIMLGVMLGSVAATILLTHSQEVWVALQFLLG